MCSILDLFIITYFFDYYLITCEWKCESHSVMSDSFQPPWAIYSPPDSFVHGSPQTRILEWVAIPFSKGSSQPRGSPEFPVLQADSSLSELPGKPS